MWIAPLKRTVPFSRWRNRNHKRKCRHSVWTHLYWVNSSHPFCMNGIWPQTQKFKWIVIFFSDDLILKLYYPNNITSNFRGSCTCNMFLCFERLYYWSKINCTLLCKMYDKYKINVSFQNVASYDNSTPELPYILKESSV